MTSSAAAVVNACGYIEHPHHGVQCLLRAGACLFCLIASRYRLSGRPDMTVLY